MKKKKRSWGHTLLELLLVVIIVGVLAAVGIPRFTNLVDKQGLREAEAILKAIRTSERFYFLGPGRGGYANDLNQLSLDQGSIGNSQYSYIFTGTPVNGAQARDGATPVRNIDFDTGDITIP